MPLVNLKDIIEDARQNKYSLGCFNVFNTESLEGTITAAINMKSPVVLAIYQLHFKYSNLESFTVLARKVANMVDIPVALHLEYATSLKEIVRAIRYGFTSLMFVGPEDIGLGQKIELTKKAAEIAHSGGLLLESEISGMVTAGENSSKSNGAGLEQTIEFINKTGIDILSPDIGSVHGLTEGKATLNLNLLDEINAATNCYLSMHGGSGVDDETIRKAINLGICKSSVFSLISKTAVNRIKTAVASNPDIVSLSNETRKGFKEAIENRLEVFGSKNIVKTKANRSYINNIKTGAEKTDMVELITKEILKQIRTKL
ncbi:MAG: class II fructose-bisphosphate aldolase [Actinomycetota bacterium]